MYQDVRELNQFYSGTKLGELAQKTLSDKVVGFWENTKGLTVAGYGFAVPVMAPLIETSRRGLVLMPSQQGVMVWPNINKNISILCEETQWPISTGFIDRLVVLHGLETCENPRDLLLEIYRVLGPGGRALFIVPNRLGLWARRDSNPFAFGRPYSLGQLERQTRACGLLPKMHKAALFFPPSDKKFWQKLSASWETLGSKLSGRFAGGVLMLEVYKQIPAPTKPGLGEFVRKPLIVLEGLTKPPGKHAATSYLKDWLGLFEQKFTDSFLSDCSLLEIFLTHWKAIEKILSLVDLGGCHRLQPLLIRRLFTSLSLMERNKKTPTTSF